MDTPEQIEAIEARLSAASEGPWDQETEQIGKRSKPVLLIWSKAHVVCRVGTVGMPKAKEDTDFIQHAPTDIAFLLHALTAERERANVNHTAWQAAQVKANNHYARVRELEEENVALVAKADAFRLEAAQRLQEEQERAGRMQAAIERYLELESACDYTGDEPAVCPGIEKVGGPCHWCELRAAVKGAGNETPS